MDKPITFVNAPQTSNSNITINKKLRKEYATTLLLWGHDRAFEYQEDRQYPTYYQYECGVSNPQKLQEELFQKGYYCEATFCEIFESYTLNELKIIADSIGIPKSGKKSDLITRILCNSHPDELHAHIGNRKYFTLSSKGKTYLQLHHDYVVFHKYSSFRISIEAYEIAKNKLQSFDCETVLIYLMCQRVQKNRFDILSYSYLKKLYDNTNQLDKAMLTFLLLLYFDVNYFFGFSWYFGDLKYMSPEYAKESLIKHLHQQDFLQIDHATYFLKNIKFFKPDMIDYIYQSYQLDFLIVSKSMFLNILNDMKECAFFDTEKWNKLIYQKLKLTCKKI